MMVHEAFHWHDFDDSVRNNAFYSPKHLVFYVTHDEEWLSEEGGISNQNFLNLLRATGFEYGLDSGFEPLHFVRSVNDNLPQHFTLFRVATGTIEVELFYEKIFAHIHESGLSCNLQDGEIYDEGVVLKRLALPDNAETINNAYLEHAMLEWYAGGAPHTGLGAHGPGGKPRKVDAANIGKWKFEFADGLTDYKVYEKTPCADVEVYVLDTIPSKCRIKQALKNWPGLKPYEKILAPYGPDYDPNIYETENATYIYAAAMGQDFSGTYVLNDPTHPILLNDPNRKHFEREHQYDFSDHGLFISGIVHSIAPYAHLNVIQVMNDYGIGTFWNFAAGFQEVARRHRKYHAHKHAIINCSFTLSVPIGEHYRDYNKKDLHPTLAKLEQQNPQFRASLCEVVTALSECINEDARVIAASGNDSNRNTKIEARYPANASSVIGVGALGSNGDYAHYSNKADNPVSDGIITFGGEYEDPSLTAGSPQLADEGIIGIFTGNLNIRRKTKDKGYDPNLFDNPYGLAEWQGTSFASPIVAGTLALLCCGKCVKPEDALIDLKGKISAMSGAGQNRAKKLDKIKQVKR